MEIQQNESVREATLQKYKELLFWAKKNGQVLQKIQKNQQKIVQLASSQNISIHQLISTNSNKNTQTTKAKFIIFQNAIKILEKEISQLSYREFFWQWMESIIMEDKKKCIVHPDYGLTSGVRYKRVV